MNILLEQLQQANKIITLLCQNKMEAEQAAEAQLNTESSIPILNFKEPKVNISDQMFAEKGKVEAFLAQLNFCFKLQHSFFPDDSTKSSESFSKVCL